MSRDDQRTMTQEIQTAKTVKRILSARGSRAEAFPYFCPVSRAKIMLSAKEDFL